ncbi:MAG: hypothetical protein N2110_02820 [Flavobacteriales bacterium]|nr:hypothetical protein [Flavobacteriales bacterium]
MASCISKTKARRPNCFPTIYIDSNELVVGTSDIYGINLPYWLREGQSLAIGSGVKSISVIEFTPTSTNDLEFSQVRNVTNASSTPAVVPAGKVWKIESVAKDINDLISSTSFTFNTPGTSNFQPPCTGFFKIQVWGGGGGGGGSYGSTYASAGYEGGGGGGGGYAEGVYYLNKNLSYTVSVGAGGAGGTATSTSASPGSPGGMSSFGLGSVLIISASGGGGGGVGINCCSVGSGGVGGTGFGQINVAGQTGFSGDGTNASRGGNAGQTLNTGSTAQTCPGGNGVAPGGGGAGGYSFGATCNGGNGAPGRVVISSVVR